VLEQIEYKHTLRVNLVDPKQNLVPLFFGNLNFIASQTPNYWFLYLRMGEQEEAKKWPGLIFTDDIANMAVELEKIWIKEPGVTIEQLIRTIPLTFQVHTFESDEELRIPEGFFPYYEGLNKNENDETYWAGFYWRNNRYPVTFLREISRLCNQTGLGKICITPWKTFLVKGISPEHKIFWEALIGQFGINMRHSSFELNWHLPLLDEQAYKLKKFIVAQFDQFDIRTFGISFTIQTKPIELFTNVVVKVEGSLNLPEWLDVLRSYSIYYAFDFNPNSSQYILFEQNISKKDLPQKLNELTKRYYSGISIPGREAWTKLAKKKQIQSIQVHQCKNCLTIYDHRYGDVLAGIQAGTTFEKLSLYYRCPVCETQKSDFAAVQIAEVLE
jgi:rubredoxin